MKAKLLALTVILAAFACGCNTPTSAAIDPPKPPGTGLRKGGGHIGGAADMDVIPAPKGVKTGTKGVN